MYVITRPQWIKSWLSCDGIESNKPLPKTILAILQSIYLWNILNPCCVLTQFTPLQWHHNKHKGISDHWHLHCLSTVWSCTDQRKLQKLHVTGLCVGNSLVTGEFPAQKASNLENVSIWWRHHDTLSQPRERFLVLASHWFLHYWRGHLPTVFTLNAIHTVICNIGCHVCS